MTIVAGGISRLGVRVPSDLMEDTLSLEYMEF
jgi:hypothetical protein